MSTLGWPLVILVSLAWTTARAAAEFPVSSTNLPQFHFANVSDVQVSPLSLQPCSGDDCNPEDPENKKRLLFGDMYNKAKYSKTDYSHSDSSPSHSSHSDSSVYDLSYLDKSHSQISSHYSDSDHSQSDYGDSDHSDSDHSESHHSESHYSDSHHSSSESSDSRRHANNNAYSKPNKYGWSNIYGWLNKLIGPNKYGGSNNYGGSNYYGPPPPTCPAGYTPAIWNTRSAQQPCGLDVDNCYCKNSPYRELGGFCNHEEGFGTVYTPFLRILKARYTDGKSKVPKTGGSEGLPSPRTISITLFKDGHNPSDVHALSLMQWAQVVTHDIGFQEEKTDDNYEPFDCCQQSEHHDDKSWNSKCLPIYVDKDDYYYSKHKRRCLNFVRSEWIRCKKDYHDSNSNKRIPVQQINHVSSFLDASILYGDTQELGDFLREGKGGRLKARKVRKAYKKDHYHHYHGSGYYGSGSGYYGSGSGYYGSGSGYPGSGSGYYGSGSGYYGSGSGYYGSGSGYYGSGSGYPGSGSGYYGSGSGYYGSGSGYYGSGSGYHGSGSGYYGSGSGYYGSGSGYPGSGSGYYGSGSGYYGSGSGYYGSGSGYYGSGSGYYGSGSGYYGSGSGYYGSGSGYYGSGSGYPGSGSGYYGSGSGYYGSGSGYPGPGYGPWGPGYGHPSYWHSSESSSSSSSSSSEEDYHTGQEFPLLLHEYDKRCYEGSSKKNSCYLSGDERVNDHPWLTSFHVLLLREHNRLARLLSNMHPEWRDETVFQEARRIVIAELSLITYRDFLKKIVGEKILQKLNLVVGVEGQPPSGSYNGSVNPSTLTVFSSAAFRYLHSLIEGRLQTQNEGRCPVKLMYLSDLHYHSTILEKPDYLNSIFRGMTNQPSENNDQYFTTEITNKLFKSKKGYGKDLVSIDIQRGRDHGLPSYNDMREICGLPKATNFNDFLDVMSQQSVHALMDLYHTVDDVDLYVGGSLENHCTYGDSSGLVGPTFGCIIAEQFFRLRQGDRYFFDRANGPGSFTTAQYNAILKVSLSSLLCDNLEGLKYMQMDAFRIISYQNPLKHCGEIPRLDLAAWMNYNPPKNCASKNKKKKNKRKNKKGSSHSKYRRHGL